MMMLPCAYAPTTHGAGPATRALSCDQAGEHTRQFTATAHTHRNSCLPKNNMNLNGHLNSKNKAQDRL
jgi:hypothetical protein